MEHLELLAPARNAAVARQAILHGADAVYMGASSHGARAAASNSLDDVARTVDLAHIYNARVYVTVNTLVYEKELKEVEHLVHKLWHLGVDALIVQDMSLLRRDLPPIALHASTQCDIRTPERARFLAEVGFSQLVLPREATIAEIEQYRRAVPKGVELEAFVHGALCVCYSGDCQASFVHTGRSANRGECAQLCRLPYSLTDAQGNVLCRDKHLLSLRDLNRASNLGEMARAGVRSFKIEGRLKDEMYVKNVVAEYSRLLNTVVDASEGRFARLSEGESRITFRPDVSRSFNRGFTSYFLTPTPAPDMAAKDTPKWIGQEVGTVSKILGGKRLQAKLGAQLANGDGLGYFDRDGRFNGFRLNRVEGNTLIAASEVSLTPGTKLYRNADITFEKSLAGDTATRTLAVDFTLRQAPDGRVVLDASDHYGHSATVATEQPVTDMARTPQASRRHDTLSKTGGTHYSVARVEDTLNNLFIPASQLTALRREALQLLDTSRRVSRKTEQRRAENRDARVPDTSLTYHHNVANSLAHRFYTEHGATSIEPALEAQPPREGPLTVMTTRYCLRRELGACLRTPQGARLPRDLYLRAPGLNLRLDFDCAQCRMHVVRP